MYEQYWASRSTRYLPFQPFTIRPSPMGNYRFIYPCATCWAVAGWEPNRCAVGLYNPPGLLSFFTSAIFTAVALALAALSASASHPNAFAFAFFPITQSYLSPRPKWHCARRRRRGPPAPILEPLAKAGWATSANHCSTRTTWSSWSCLAFSPPGRPSCLAKMSSPPLAMGERSSLPRFSMLAYDFLVTISCPSSSRCMGQSFHS